MGIFLKLKQIQDTILEVITQDAVANQIHQASLLVGIVITIYVLFHGYLILAGKTQDPIKELIWKMVGWFLIISFAYKSPDLVTSVSNAINGIHTWASDSDLGLWGKLQDVFDNATLVASIMEKQDGTFELTGFFSGVVVLFGFSIFALSSIVIIVMTSFFLKVLIMIAPIAILSKLFGWTKGVFEGWLELIISNALTVMLVSVFFNIVNVQYEKIIEKAIGKAEKTQVLGLSFEIFYASILATVLILMAVKISDKLSRFSLEQISDGKASSATKEYFRNKRKNK